VQAVPGVIGEPDPDTPVLRGRAVPDVADGSGIVEIATVVKTPPKEAVVEDSATLLLVGLDNWEVEVVIPFLIVSLSQPLSPDDQPVRRLAMFEA